MTGYVKLWRKALENGWLRNHKLWVFWSYCMLKATYKTRTVFHGWQEIQLEAGAFIFGRKQCAKDTGLSERSIRTCIEHLRKAGNLTIKTTNRFSIITLENWAQYQFEGEETTSKTTCRRPAGDHKQEGKNERIKDPACFLSEFAVEERRTIQQTLDAIASTRKTGTLSASKQATILQRLLTYPRQQTINGCQKFLEKSYHLEGKREQYLFGIIRNNGNGAAAPAPASISTGSRLLDEYYRERAAQ